MAWELTQFVGRARDRALDMRPFFRWVANRLRAEFRANFEQGGRPAWRPLAASTVAWKRFLNLPAGLRTPSGRVPRRLLQRGQLDERTMLILTGDLRDSVIQKAHPLHVERVSHERVEVGTRHPLAPIHEFGTRPYTIVPRRPNGRLRFMAPSGQFVYARAVHHPGVPARPFLQVPVQTQLEILQAMGDYIAGGGSTSWMP